MDSIEKYSTKSNEIPGQMHGEYPITALLKEMQITFPDTISHDDYHNEIRDYYETLDAILEQFHYDN